MPFRPYHVDDRARARKKNEKFRLLKTLMASGERLRARSIPNTIMPDHSNHIRVNLVHRRMLTSVFPEFAVSKWHCHKARPGKGQGELFVQDP